MIVDYGRGNLLSLQRALEHIGHPTETSADPDRLRGAPRLILPGVGAFGDGMEGLRRRGLDQAVRDFARSGRPVLGICLGMQLMLERGTEFGDFAGLALVPGDVVRFPESAAKVPHVAWSPLLPPKDGPGWGGTLFDGLSPGACVYFVHSYFARPKNPAHRISETGYGGVDFCSAFSAENVSGCQFHPEKSGPVGLRILRNWFEDQR